MSEIHLFNIMQRRAKRSGIHIDIRASVEGLVHAYAVDAQRPDIVLRDFGVGGNLITDVGMDMPGTYSWADTSKYGYLSTDTVEPVAGDTTMPNLGQKTSDYSVGDGSTTSSGDTVTWKRGHLFPEVTTATTFAKYGCAPTLADNANMFAQKLFDTPLSLEANQRAKIDRITRVTFAPHVTESSDFEVDGLIDSNGLSVTGAGTARIPSFCLGNEGALVTSISSNGVSSYAGNSGLLEPSSIASGAYIGLSTSDALLSADDTLSRPPTPKMSTGTSATQIYGGNGTATLPAYLTSWSALHGSLALEPFPAYVAGSHSRSRMFLADLSDCNISAARSLGFVHQWNQVTTTYSGWLWQWLCDNEFAKLNTHSLALAVTLSWTRAS